MLTGRKLALTLAFTVLIAVAAGVSCRGFFQPNSLVSVAVQPPSPDVQLGQTTTLQAWGTYEDNTRSQITSGVAWSSSDPTIMSVDPNSGVATGLAIGTATITAAAQGISGTASGTVFINITSLVVTPDTWSFKAASGGTKSFTVQANGNTDVTLGAIFTPSDTTDFNCVNGTEPVVCTAGSATPQGSYTITVSYTGSTITDTIAVTATP